MDLLIAARRKALTLKKKRKERKKERTQSAEGKRIGTKQTLSQSECCQITGPGSVFFLGCCAAKAGNAGREGLNHGGGDTCGVWKKTES